MSKTITITIAEADFVELLGAIELADAAAALVPGSDSDARRETLAELTALLETAAEETAS